MEPQFQYYPSSPPPSSPPPFSPPPTMTSQQGFAPPYRISNSRIWYAALLPIISLFIELYASSLILGLLVWSLCIIMSITACLLDRKYLSELGVDVTPLNPVLAVIPPIYMFRRAALVGDRPSAGAVCIITIAYALMFNGFTKASGLKDKDFIDQVRYNSWISISGLERNKDAMRTSDMIGDTLDSYAKNKLGEASVEWSADKNSSDVMITAQTEDGSMKIEFYFTFDGYVCQKTEVRSVTLYGSVYKDEKAAEKLEKMLKELNGGDDSDDDADESDESDESSEEDKPDKE